jgi:IS605 OrfB family transposase
MKIVSSYGIEIRNMNKIFMPTVAVYNNAISFCIDVFENEWSDIECFDRMKRKQYAENLIHNTKNNKAKYEGFDTRFHKMPSYMRRAVINTALGYLSSYHSNLDNWYDNNCQGTPPTLQRHLNQFPTFYKDNMYSECDGDTVKLKIYKDNDWKWITVKLKHTDMQYIRKHLSGTKMSVPTLEKKHHKWFLRFAFEEDVKLKDNKDTILAIDLGINTDATCSVMRKDGTVLARKFINFAGEKDQLTHTLNKIKGVSQKYGSHNTTKLWRYAKFKNEELARKIAKTITDYAVEQNVDVIVFEYLNTKGKKQGRKRQKLHMWKKNSIQKYVEHKAHRQGIRVSRICAWGTSKLAYDGSGRVLRGKDAGFSTYELCKFSNGKIYNCDLSASYNIGARYFIRELEKSTSAKKWSLIQAKVPECAKRTQCTYNTFVEILKVA